MRGRIKEVAIKVYLCEFSQGPARADVPNGAENKRRQGSEMVSKPFIAERHPRWLKKISQGAAKVEVMVQSLRALR